MIKISGKLIEFCAVYKHLWYPCKSIPKIYEVSNVPLTRAFFYLQCSRRSLKIYLTTFSICNVIYFWELPLYLRKNRRFLRPKVGKRQRLCEHMMICTFLVISHFLIRILFSSSTKASDSYSTNGDITMYGTTERRCIMTKSDGVQRGRLVGDIIKRFEQKRI